MKKTTVVVLLVSIFAVQPTSGIIVRLLCNAQMMWCEASAERAYNRCVDYNIAEEVQCAADRADEYQICHLDWEHCMGHDH